MYYERYAPKRKRKRRRRSPGWALTRLLLKLLALLLVVAALAAGVLYALPVSTFMVEPEGLSLSLTDGLPTSAINVLLLGTDVLRENAQRSDGIMIASIGYGRLSLTSILRDTLVDIPGHGRGRLNAAYAYGGPELVMRTVNENFRLNIMHYLTVDFAALVAVVDAVGGVELDITEAEMERINRSVLTTRALFQPLGYTAQELTRFGEGVRLDGLQALAYARLRKLDSDFMRTSRQRRLVNALIRRVRENLWNPVMLWRLGKVLLEAVQTNMSPGMMLSLGEKALIASDVRQLRLPVDNAYTDDGATLTVTDPDANIAAFRGFVYE